MAIFNMKLVNDRISRSASRIQTILCADGTLWKVRTDASMVTGIIFSKLNPLMTIKQQANEIS